MLERKRGWGRGGGGCGGERERARAHAREFRVEGLARERGSERGEQ
jgi:hypothetical protein